MTEFEKLIVKFAEGREICNCGEAYLTNCGEGIKAGERFISYDIPCCKGGCGANQIDAKEYIASRIIELLPTV